MTTTTKIIYFPDNRELEEVGQKSVTRLAKEFTLTIARRVSGASKQISRDEFESELSILLTEVRSAAYLKGYKAGQRSERRNQVDSPNSR